MPEAKPTLLVVEDDPDVADMLSAYFNVQGYAVYTVNWGEDALQACRTHRPDLIILDIRLPDIDGYEVARRLRTSRRTDEIPIIFLTEKRNRLDRLQGLELGADDYITKPFDIQELRLRVRNALRRAAQGSHSNPVTNLPEGSLVDERLSECLESNQWTAILVSLENLDVFREAYGFVASDDVLRAVNLMIHNAVRELGNPSDFIGQLEPAGFIIVSTPAAASELAKRIRSRLEQALDYFYPIKDREAGYRSAYGLDVHLRQINSHQGPFASVDALKNALMG